ncbi:MAG: NACHT domain-containing protein, partial [bacterium]
FLTKIKSISSKYNFTWIKDIRDAGLFIGNGPIEAVHFYQEALEQFPISPKRETIHRGFVIKFRLAAHFCSFKAEYNSHQQIIDISGGEIDFLFKDMEKEATAGQMVVSPDFYKQFSADITSKGFGFTPFVARDTMTTLYLLILPVLLSPDILSVSDTTLLLDKMNELKQNVQKIKTLGGLYPDLNMEDQFIELRLTTPVLSEERREEWDIIDFQKYGRQKAQKAEQKNLLKCDEIYERHPHLFIKGIPGVGKTTILKYFCFKGFNSDKYPIFIPCHTIPNIEQWEQDYPYASKDIKKFMVDLVTSAFIYPGRSYKELTAQEKQTLAKMAETVRKWATQGKAIFCLDALDEVTNTSQQKQILNKVALWFKSTPESHIYLTARDHTFFEISEDVLLASVNPLAVDQFQDLGRKFFEGKKNLLQKFNQASVDQQEVVALIANTPLLATLVLVWFKKKGEFARRPIILHFITLFILLRIWDRLKNPDFQKSIDEVFNLTLDPRAIENDEELSSLINALEEVVWHAVQGYREGFVSRFKEDVILNILKQLTTIPAGSSADDLLKNLVEGYFLLRITQAPNFYTFIHLSVLEFLAARRLAKIAGDEFLNRFHEFMTNEGLFPLEILPLFSALSFENLKKAISALKNDDQVSKQLQRDGMGLRILIEAEGFIRDQTDDYRNQILIRNHQSLINDFKAVKDKFLTRFTDYLGENDLGKLKEYASVFNATSRFEDRELLSKLDYSLFEAEPELAASRDTLLEQMVYFRLIEDWKTEKRNLRRKEEKVLPTGLKNILQLDSKEYDADDKHFNYYATLIPELVGFFGSPNLRHSSAVTSGVFSGDGKYILSASRDKTLKLWDKETGQEVRTFKGHSDAVFSGVFSGDGKYILSASRDNTLKLWDKETGQEVRTFKGHSDEVT